VSDRAPQTPDLSDVPSLPALYADDRETEARRGKRAGRTTPEGGTTMASTSSDLTAGTAITGQHGNGKGSKGRAADLVATVALGLGLLGGLVLNQAHHGARPAGTRDAYPYVIQGAQYPAGLAQVTNSASDLGTAFDPYIIQGSLPMSVVAPRLWTGTCRAGGSDCLPGDDDYAPALPHALPQGWTGSCRPGGSDCVPDEDVLTGAPAQAGAASGTLSGGSYADLVWELDQAIRAANNGTSSFVPDQFTYREDHRASAAASVASFRPDRLPSEYRV
jgi:hypothetical protein